MSVIGSNILAGASGQGGAYEIEQSLRFDGSAYLSRSLGTTSSSWTVSFWTKTALNDSHDGYWFNTSQAAIYMDSSSGAPSDRRYKFRDASSGSLIVSSAVIRDPSAWYHVVYKCDGSNRRLYVNNSLDAGFTYSGSTTLSGSSAIGAYYTGSGSQLEGYIAEFHLVDGSALDPDQFAELDDNGVWRPIEYTGSHGTNGFYLTFDPSATNGIGHDHSGNGNNFTPSGFTTSGTGTDVMSDTPTTNWCTLNPLSFGPSNAEMIDGNLQFNQPTSTRGNAKGTIAVSSGKWYWEVTPQSTATANVAGGILGAAETDIANQPGNYATGYSYGSTGETRHNNVDVTYGDSYGAGDVIGTALDLDAGTLVFYKNGVSQGTAYSSLSGTFVPAIGDTSTGSSSQLICNFGQRAFEYTPPTGFKALNTANLPAPDIADGSQYFNTVLYTGNDSDRNIDVGFKSDFVWIKERSSTPAHRLYDSVRGDGQTLFSNLTNAEYDGVNDGVNFAYADGFNIDVGLNVGSYNGSGDTYVAWNWLAGGSGSSNTDGSITSTVSANPTAGFSIVSYTGNGTDGSTVGHGLGVSPSFILTKNRDGGDSGVAGGWWSIYHPNLPNKHFYGFNTTDPNDNAWNNHGYINTVSSTTWTLSTGDYGGTSEVNNWWVNASGKKYIAYCFAEVEGYSKFGSYIGNGSSDGPFVFLGFRPKFLLYKRTDATQNWILHDSVRASYNVNSIRLFPNLSDAEATTSGTNDIDFVSNGFKCRSSHPETNTSGGTYIFAAFAENPFGGSGVSPATAR